MKSVSGSGKEEQELHSNVDSISTELGSILEVEGKAEENSKNVFQYLKFHFVWVWI